MRKSPLGVGVRVRVRVRLRVRVRVRLRVRLRVRVLCKIPQEFGPFVHFQHFSILTLDRCKGGS